MSTWAADSATSGGVDIQSRVFIMGVFTYLLCEIWNSERMPRMKREFGQAAGDRSW